MLNLEGAQAGLSWLTVLQKRDRYRQVFDNFDAAKIAQYDDTKRSTLLADAGIIRNLLKINAFIRNAQACLATTTEYGSFDAYLWSFVSGTPMPYSQRQAAQSIGQVMSKDLKKRGFTFVGPTIIYAFMQATGMVNDHEPGCFRYVAS